MRSRLPFIAAVAALVAVPALAAVQTPEPTSHNSEVIFFIELTLLIAAGRIGGEIMQRLGQPAVMGQLLAGIVLGPSVFGALWPSMQAQVFPTDAEQHGMIDAVAQVGVLLLLLLTGMETDLRLVRRVGPPALFVSFAGIAVPFALGFGVGMVAPDWVIPHPEMRVVTALFLGTALSIASVKIVAMVVRDLGFLRRNIGQIILASAVLDDTLGWIIIGVISGLTAHGELHLGSIATTLVGVVIFIVASLTIGRRAVSLMIRWSNDHLVSEMPVISVILVITIVMALITQGLGVHTVLGAFVAGVLIGESPILTKHIDEELRGLITALFMPVFFGLAGLSADLTVLVNPTLLALTVGLILIASLGKFGGAFLGGWLGGLTFRERVALACGMNARGSTEVIVATIGLSIGALDRDLYTMIVTMAVVTTLAMPPMLRWALKRLPLSDEEKTRLEREAFEEKGFVTNLERLLVTADASPNGRLAAHLAGLLAGQRGLPTTVLRWSKVGPEPEPEDDDETEDIVALVGGAAEAARVTETQAGQGPTKVDVTTRLAGAEIEQSVATEAERGYDMLFVGVEGTGESDSPVAEDVARAAIAFEGPVSIAHALGEGELGRELRILVPITGTNVARRAAEVAVALARATNGRVTALYVSPQRRRGIAHSLSGLLRSEEALLRDVMQLGEQSGATVRTAVRTGVPPDQAILRSAHAGRHDIIVMGVNRRPGESLSFGPVADRVLEGSRRPVLFVAS